MGLHRGWIGVTLEDGSGRQNGGGLSYFLPGSLAGGLVASRMWEATPVSCLFSPLS